MSDQHTGPVQVTDNPDKSRFEVTVDGHLAGFADYRRRPGKVVFTHTEIDPSYQGHHLGGQLASAALDSVRAEGSEVTPLCPYIAGYIRRHPEYVELVDEEHRADFAT